MEIKINKEIQDYKESVFFGLNMRQLIFSILAVAAGAVSYIVLRPRLGLDAASWICILLAAPFAACGFVRYHGMPAEKIAWAWIKSEILVPKKLVFRGGTNIYLNAMKPYYEKTLEEEVNDKINRKHD